MSSANKTGALRLPAAVSARLRGEVPGVAEQVVAAVMAAVPAYADPFRGRMGRTIETAVSAALEGFVNLASSPEGLTPGSQVQVVYDAAYELGRGEARSGRSMDALSSAYRVGARRAWQDMSNTMVKSGMPAADLARFADAVFAYIDELSDMSVRGHVEELASSGRLRQRRLERLVTKLLEGDPEEALVDAAERAEWSPPKTLTAVLLPEGEARQVRNTLSADTLQAGEDVDGLDAELTVLLVPDVAGRSRSALFRALRGSTAVIGPPVAWTDARSSYSRAVQAHRLGLEGDTNEHLVSLVLGADPGAMADLRLRVLAPLEKLSPTSREKLTQTLRAWLLHHGRRDDIAAALFVHPQTVRYRMGQLRELFGDRLEDPQAVLELTVALGSPSASGSRS